MPRSAQYWVRVSLMNTLSLSESMPLTGKSNCRPMASSPATTRVCSRASSGTASVQPVQISVATRLWIMEPHQEPPWWTTRSISRNPGGGAFQSAKVRTGILRPGD